MISSDRKLLEDRSAVSERMKEYGDLVAELNVVLLSDARHKLKNTQLSKNVWVYPTNSLINFLRPLDATRLCKKIVFDKKFVRGKSMITAQDPFEAGLAAWRIASTFDIPLQLQIHTDFLSSYFARHSLVNRIRVMVARFLIPRASGIRVVSERIRSSLLSRFHRLTNIISVVPIFVDLEKIRSAQTADLKKKYSHFDHIILIASRLTREKNIPMALRAFAEVVKKYPRAGLLIVGSGPEERFLKLYAKQLRIHTSVVFGGWQDNLAPYYKAVRVFLSTSRYEGYGLAVVEAAAAGALVVSTDVGVASTLLPERYRFEPNDEEDLRWILTRAVGDSKDRQDSLRFIREHLSYVTYKNKEAYLTAFKEGFDALFK